MTASNMVEMPRELVARLVAAVETPLDLDEQDINELIEDVQAYFPDGIVEKEKRKLFCWDNGEESFVLFVESELENKVLLCSDISLRFHYHVHADGIVTDDRDEGFVHGRVANWYYEGDA